MKVWIPAPILAQSEPVSVSSDVRCDALTEHLFEMGAGMLPDVLKDYNAGKLTPRPQNDTDATSTSLITKSDGYIDWSTSADYIVRMIRAYHPWPGTSTSLHCDTFKVIDAENCADTTTVPRLDSGTVFRSDDGSRVRCGRTWVIREVGHCSSRRKTCNLGNRIRQRQGLSSLVLN